MGGGTTRAPRTPRTTRTRRVVRAKGNHRRGVQEGTWSVRLILTAVALILKALTRVLSPPATTLVKRVPPHHHHRRRHHHQRAPSVQPITARSRHGAGDGARRPGTSAHAQRLAMARCRLGRGPESGGAVAAPPTPRRRRPRTPRPCRNRTRTGGKGVPPTTASPASTVQEPYQEFL